MINQKRKIKRSIDGGIKIEEWVKYFGRLLKKVKGEVMRDMR